jgi:gentisate 1,2-dioxygenase
MSGRSRPEDTARLDAELAAIQIEGHWKSNQDGLPAEPGGSAEPYLWRWADVYPGLLKAGDLLGNEAGASRRTLRLCTPGVPGKATTRTIHTSIQMVKPGEVAKMHRHSISAFRFVIGGSGGVTAVDGRRFTMNRSDLVLTPQWTWHEHSNDAAEPMIWIDGHDMPLMRSLETIFFQPANAHNGGAQQEWDDLSGVAQAEPHTYGGEDSLARLRALGSDSWTPYAGRVFDYRHPRTGGPTLPTIMCRLHAFDAGEITRRHRQTASTIFYVIEGSGVTEAGGKSLEWQPGDIFTVPNWTWHFHRIHRQTPAVLFSVSDEPILAALGHWRREGDASTESRREGGASTESRRESESQADATITTIDHGVRRHG